MTEDFTGLNFGHKDRHNYDLTMLKVNISNSQQIN